LFFVCALAAMLRAEPPSSFAIRDARVVTVSGSELAKATVLVKDGMIVDVGPNLAIPADAWVIDGSGLTVYPGFINALSTWGIPEVAPAAGAASRATAAPAATPQPVPRRNHACAARKTALKITVTSAPRIW